MGACQAREEIKIEEVELDPQAKCSNFEARICLKDVLLEEYFTFIQKLPHNEDRVKADDFAKYLSILKINPAEYLDPIYAELRAIFSSDLFYDRSLKCIFYSSLFYFGLIYCESGIRKRIEILWEYLDAEKKEKVAHARLKDAIFFIFQLVAALIPSVAITCSSPRTDYRSFLRNLSFNLDKKFKALMLAFSNVKFFQKEEFLKHVPHMLFRPTQLRYHIAETSDIRVDSETRSPIKRSLSRTSSENLLLI